MKNFKVTYLTTSGKVFKTITPNDYQNYMDAHYDKRIAILSARPTKKTKYAKYVNVSQ